VACQVRRRSELRFALGVGELWRDLIDAVLVQQQDGRDYILAQTIGCQSHDLPRAGALKRLMTMRQGLAIGILAVLLSNVAARADEPKNACREGAIADFKSRLDLIQQQSPVLSVDAMIAVRRLEEEFCVRLVNVSRRVSALLPPYAK
jgi:hypothetical protein